MKTAIILGATGLTGGILLQDLIADFRYEKIILFSRSRAAVKSNKVEEHLIDLFQLEQQKHLFKANEVYCCIGTTKNKTPNEDVYRKIDYGIPVTAANLAKENGIPTFSVISALGADEKSNMFYNRIKGEMERDVLSKKIENTFIFQPSLIAGNREEKRPMENLAKQAMKIINYVLVGPLAKYKSIDPSTIATSMIKVSNSGYSKNIIPSNEIKEIAKVNRE